VKIVTFDAENFKITAEAYGEPFDLAKHPQGTEIKAITYASMQVIDEVDKHEVFVIVDI
jgi:SHS2 domain-containing protein